MADLTRPEPDRSAMKSRTLLPAEPELSPPPARWRLLWPAVLAVVGILIAWVAATSGQDARRHNDLMNMQSAVLQAQEQLDRAKLAGAPAEKIAALQNDLAEKQSAALPSYSQPGRQFTEWDGYRYEEIAEKGYVYHQPGDSHEVKDDSTMLQPGWSERRLKNVSWYPLYPLLGWTVAHVTGMSVNHALTAVSWICCVGAAVLAYGLGRRHFYAAAAFPRPADLAAADSAALWKIALLLFGPCSIFLYANFTESVFVMLLAAFLYCLQSRWWWRAALVAAIASACRSQGVLFGPILAVSFLLRSPWNRPARNFGIAMVLGIISSAGLLCYMAFLQAQFHDPLAFMHAQKYWNVGIGAQQLAAALSPINALHHLLMYATGAQAGPTHGAIDWPRLWESLCIFWPPMVLLLGHRRISLELTLVGWVLWVLPYISNSAAGSSAENPSHWMSMGRFMAVLLPVYMIVAPTFARRPALAIAFIVPWAAAFALFAYKFGTGVWVG